MSLFKKLFKDKEKDKKQPPPEEEPVQQEKLTKDDFEMLQVLGKGSFAQVLLAKRLSSGQIFAIKVVTKQGLLDHKRVNDVFTERNVLMRANHPYLLKLHNTFQSEHKLYFVMDYMPGGDLDKYMNSQPNKMLDPQTSRLYAAQVFLALTYLHDKAVIYRDLKPENILMSAEGHCVLADFGLSKDFHKDGQSDAEQNLKANSFVGSPFYVSPDVLKQKEYTQAIDFWSFGILLYRMLCGRPPFSGRNMKEVFDNILLTELRFPSSVQVADDAKDLISRCLIKDAGKRITAPEIKAHPYWKGQSWEEVMAGRVLPAYWKPLSDAQVTGKTNTAQSESKANAVSATPQDASAMPSQHQNLFSGFTCENNTAMPGQ